MLTSVLLGWLLVSVPVAVCIGRGIRLGETAFPCYEDDRSWGRFGAAASTTAGAGMFAAAESPRHPVVSAGG